MNCLFIICDEKAVDFNKQSKELAFKNKMHSITSEI